MNEVIEKKSLTLFMQLGLNRIVNTTFRIFLIEKELPYEQYPIIPPFASEDT